MSECCKRDNDFLAEIYRGARMGTETIDSIIPKVTDAEMKKELIREQSEYRRFEEKAVTAITERGDTPEPIGKMQEFCAWMGIKMNTAIDCSSSHIADLMIQGNNMGVVGITKSKNSHSASDKEIVELADELIKIQEDNIERLKPFLK